MTLTSGPPRRGCNSDWAAPLVPLVEPEDWGRSGALSRPHSIMILPASWLILLSIPSSSILLQSNGWVDCWPGALMPGLEGIAAKEGAEPPNAANAPNAPRAISAATSNNSVRLFMRFLVPFLGLIPPVGQ